MTNERNDRWTADRIVAAVAEWFLKLFTVPLELMARREIGERYVGVSGLLSLLLLWAWAWWSSSAGSGLLYLFLLACIVRIVFIRVMCVRRRLEGRPIHSHRAGHSQLERFIALPGSVVQWIEPAALFVMALVLGAISQPLGEYLELASAALLVLTAVRSAASYYRILDAIDRQIEQNLPTAQVIDLRTETRQSLMPGGHIDDLRGELPTPAFVPTLFPMRLLQTDGPESVSGELSS